MISQDAATQHTVGCVLQWLDNSFFYQYISYRSVNDWPPHSFDLNPLFLCCGSYPEDRIYFSSPQTTAITQEIRSISGDTIEDVVLKLQKLYSNNAKDKGTPLEIML